MLNRRSFFKLLGIGAASTAIGGTKKINELITSEQQRLGREHKEIYAYEEQGFAVIDKGNVSDAAVSGGIQQVFTECENVSGIIHQSLFGVSFLMTIGKQQSDKFELGEYVYEINGRYTKNTSGKLLGIITGEYENHYVVKINRIS